VQNAIFDSFAVLVDRFERVVLKYLLRFLLWQKLPRCELYDLPYGEDYNVTEEIRDYNIRRAFEICGYTSVDGFYCDKV